MKNFNRGKWNFDINKALVDAGYKPTPKKVKKNKKTS